MVDSDRPVAWPVWCHSSCYGQTVPHTPSLAEEKLHAESQPPLPLGAQWFPHCHVTLSPRVKLCLYAEEGELGQAAEEKGKHI